MPEVLSYDYTYDYNISTNNGNYTPYVPDPKTLLCNIKPPDPTAALVQCILLIVIFLLAIPGNLVVGWVIGSNKQALTPSDVYLFHLTLADGLLALTLPFSAVDVVKGWVFGDFMCKFLRLVVEANFYTSIIFLACISVDRYLVIVHANESLQSRKKMCSWLLCAAVWALGWALALPALFNDVTQLTFNRMECVENFDIGRASLWRTVTRGFRHIFGFLLPLVVMVSCYSITITTLLRTRCFQKHRAMKVIIAVVVAFLLCWTPFHLTLMVDMLMRADLIPFGCTFRRLMNTALTTTHSLALSHSCINPILYAFVGEKFRDKMMQHLKKTRQDRVGSRFSRSTSQTSEGRGTIF